MGRCACGYWPGENYSGNCAACIAVITTRGAAKRGVGKGFHPSSCSVAPIKKKSASAAGLPLKVVGSVAGVSAVGPDQSKLASRRVGNAALSVLHRAQEAARKSRLSAGANSHPTETLANVGSSKDPFDVNSDEDFAEQPQLKKKTGEQPQLKKKKGVVTKVIALPKVRSRSPSPVNKKWSDFAEGQDVSPDSAAKLAEAVKAAPVLSNPIPSTLPSTEFSSGALDPQDDNAPEEHPFGPLDDNTPDELDDYDALNPSAVFAHQASTAAAAQQDNPADVHFDLGDVSKNPMTAWWDVFLNGKLGGGFLARSLLCMAHSDATLPASSKWNGPTSMTQKKHVLAEMRQKFLDWTEDAAVNEWVRAKLFHIVCTNPKTYGKLKVTRVFLDKWSYQ